MLCTSPSSPLITLDNPIPKLTLLDCEDSEDEQSGSESRAAAPKFSPHPGEPVTLLESFLIDLADGSTIVFRPATRPKSSNFGSKVVASALKASTSTT